jgi:hypothetical protein
MNSIFMPYPSGNEIYCRQYNTVYEMKEEILLALMQKQPVVVWNYLKDGEYLLRSEFLSVAKFNNYRTGVYKDEWIVAYLPPYTFEMACLVIEN